MQRKPDLIFGLHEPPGSLNTGLLLNTDATVACVDCSSLKNPKQVERLQEKAHCALKRYVENKYPGNPERFAKILLRLPATRMLTKRAAEELFFYPLIGAVRIESIMNSIISNSLAM